MSANLEQHDDIIDVEQYAKSGKKVPAGKRYQIRVDKDLFVLASESLTGAEILTLAGKTPAEKFILQQKVGNQVFRIEPSDMVSFTDPGVERFMTIPREVQDGEGAQPRRQHVLLKADTDFLDNLGLNWEAIVEGAARRVTIYSMPLVQGYNTARVDISILFGAGYPAEQIDMAYFDPPLVRSDGRPISGISSEVFDGKIWQRWSRHRTGNSVWRADIDNLSTHMALVDDWLKRELLR